MDVKDFLKFLAIVFGLMFLIIALPKGVSFLNESQEILNEMQLSKDSEADDEDSEEEQQRMIMICCCNLMVVVMTSCSCMLSHHRRRL